MKQQLRLIAASIVLFCANGAYGHHDAANHATEGKPIVWEGTVAYVSWDGAHVMYRVAVKDSTGTQQQWEILGGSPKRLASRGVYQKTVKVGDIVTVAGYLNTANKIITPVYFATSDGQKLYVGYAGDDLSFPLPQ
jgi:hypothetical protein